ncbi:MAG: sigma-70 family RNA polymerase sigma factor [bacterium]|nr:sigma-70 family RNA polymerase sigma factor [bacterium]
MRNNPWFDSQSSLTTSSFEKELKNLLLPLKKFIYKRLGSDTNAIDLVISDTLTAGWQGYKKFKHKSTYFTWLCRIALNKIADYYRDQVNERSRIVVPTLKAMSLIEATDIDPVERMALKELCDRVNDVLNLLPTEKRKLLWFRYWKDLTYAQIANILSISERAVEGRIYRAKHDFASTWTTNDK